MRRKQRIVIPSGHTVAMICSQDGHLVYKRNCIGPKFLEGLNQLNDWWALILTSNLIFVFLGVHATALDEAQANVEYVAVLHLVARHACV
jgi:hypothetical protein